ncbi:MAG: ABC transporter substrate-binding protein [Acidobacteriia bacterium]|nr:ABC transporter substrate-binding protein [Terriglobia bacterium]
MNFSRFLFCSAAVLFLSASASAQEPALQTIRVVSLPGRPLALVVAEKQGLFARHGLAVQLEAMPNSNDLRAALAAGKSDVAYAAVDNAVAMVELAHADVQIVMGGEGSLNDLIVQPEIKSIADLRGKILIVDAPNTAYAVQLKKILLSKGLQAGRDYEIKPVGATPQRLVAMREHKEFAGSMLAPPTSLLAHRDGFADLGSTLDLIGPYQAGGTFVLRPWARAHSDLLTHYLAACIEAQRWLMNPSNKQQVIAMLMQEAHLPADIAAETYQIEVSSPGGWSPDARFDLDGFRNVLKLRAEIEGSWGGQPPAVEKYYDPSYYQQALANLQQPTAKSTQ